MVARPLGDDAVVAVDIGTGSVRAIAFAADGRAMAERSRAIPTEHPAPGWAQQDPDLVARATADAIRDLVAAISRRIDIVGLVFDSQMYSVLAIGRDGRPLTPSLPWSDSRATPQAERLRLAGGAVELPAATGCPVQPMYPLAKIRWLQEQVSLGPGARFVSIKDYVIWRLTGTLIADISTASATGLLDVTTLTWCDPALRAAGIDSSQLPALAAPTATIERLKGCALTALGLPTDVPVWLGAGDAPLASVGCGAVTERTLAINIGSSAAARQMLREAVTDPAGRLWTYVLDGSHWVTGGIVGSAGSSLAHVMGLMRDGPDPLAELEPLVTAVPPGADGLLLLPYLAGEQSPEWRPDSRGAVVGLTLRHGRAHVARSALEGIAFALRRVRDALATRAHALREAAVTGGVCRSATMRQILADVLYLPILAPASHEGSARGAAVLGWLTLGAGRDLETMGAAIARGAQRTEPSPQRRAVYDDAYGRFVAAADRLGAAQEAWS